MSILLKPKKHKSMNIKNFFWAFMILVVSLLNSSCINKKEPFQQKVTFSFENKTHPSNTGLSKTVSAGKTEARYIIVTIENEKGVLIYDTKKIELYQFNGNFISEPISLDISDKQYKLTQFLVLDVDNNVIYCTPLANSSLEYLVNNPLPISFSVNKNEVSKITPEVISTNGVDASGYGYNTFDFNIIETISLKACVQIMDGVANNRKLTSAEICITSNDTIIQHSDSINAVISTLILKEGYSDYTIIASKDGYETQCVKLTNAAIKNYSQDPLTLYLQERKTQYSNMAMVVTQVGASLKYQFKSGTESVTDLIINSARIYDTNGHIKMSVSAGVGQTFSIASLTSGYYILKVDVSNSVLFSKLFFKN